MAAIVYRSLCFATTLTLFSACKTRSEESSAVLSTTAACKPKTTSVEASKVPGKPEPIRRTVDSTVYVKTLPDELAQKKSLLVFYSVDTKEKYFQAALAYEFETLKVSCNGRADARHINFLFWANSLLTGPEPRFYMCRDGRFSEEPLGKHPKLAQRLAEQTACIAKGPIDLSTQVGQLDVCGETLELPIPYPNLATEAFTAHPMAHPGVFMSIVRYGWEMFPKDEYVEFWHMKSHGSSKLFLTGLTADQTKAKDDCQESLIEDRLKQYNAKYQASRELTDVVWPEWGSVGKKPVRSYGLAIALAGLAGTGNSGDLKIDNDPNLKIDNDPNLKIDNDPNLKIDNDPNLKIDNDPNLGKDNDPKLGTDNVDLGIDTPDLGVDKNVDLGAEAGSLSIENTFASLGTAGLGTDGLGGNSQFGVSHSALGQSLMMLGLDDGSFTLGFLFAESCDSRMQEKSSMTMAFQDLATLEGFFSAGGSLWYRNLDYNSILLKWSMAGGGARELQDRMIRAAKNVKAFVTN